MTSIISRATTASAQIVILKITRALQINPTHTSATSENFSSTRSNFLTKLFFSCSIITLSFSFQYVYPL